MISFRPLRHLPRKQDPRKCYLRHLQCTEFAKPTVLTSLLPLTLSPLAGVAPAWKTCQLYQQTQVIEQPNLEPEQQLDVWWARESPVITITRHSVVRPSASEPTQVRVPKQISLEKPKEIYPGFDNSSRILLFSSLTWISSHALVMTPEGVPLNYAPRKKKQKQGTEFGRTTSKFAWEKENANSSSLVR